MSPEGTLARLQAQFGAAILDQHAHRGDCTLIVAVSELLQVASALRHDAAWSFDMPVDCTAVDYLGRPSPRFEVVWHLYATGSGQRLRLKVGVTEADPSCPSLTPIWPGMNWHEREAWDLYGIRFTGHPNLKRVLMYESFVGHPLRKDYPIDGRQPLIPMRPVRQVPTQRQPPADLLNRP